MIRVDSRILANSPYTCFSRFFENGHSALFEIFHENSHFRENRKKMCLE